MSLFLSLLVARGVADISGMGVVETTDGPMVLSDLVTDMLVEDGWWSDTQVKLIRKVGPTEILRIQTRSTSVEVTPDHTMWTKLRAKPASDLQIGDLLLVHGEWEIVVRIVKDMAVETVQVLTRNGVLSVDGVTVATDMESLFVIYWNSIMGYLKRWGGDNGGK